MKDIVCQFTGLHLAPCSPEDAGQLSEEYKRNQLVRCKTTRVSKVMEPSIRQNNLLHACFDLVANNAPTPTLDTKEKAKFACKVALDYRHLDRVAVRQDGTVVFEYKSFSFENLQDMERLRVFDRAFDWCSDQIGVTVDELVRAAQAKMHRRGTERMVV